MDKISMTEWCHKNAAWLLSPFQNGSNDVQILAFFEDEFHNENLTLEAETSVSGWT